MPEPHKSRSHSLMNLKALMSIASCFPGLFIFQLSHTQKAVLHVCLLMKGNKLRVGNKNNDSESQGRAPTYGPAYKATAKQVNV
jgi:hypothetical protein